MKKRIEELRTQASEEFTEGSRDWQNRFADLIIAECILICDDVSGDYLKHRRSTVDFGEKTIFAEGEAAADSIKHKIKRYLGA